MITEMTNPNTDFDTPWKDVLEIYFEDFVSFFFPQAHAGIDWNQGTSTSGARC